MNNKRLLLLIIVLIIWNIVLTVVLVNKKEVLTTNETNLNEVTVTGFSTDLTKVAEQVKSSVVVVETTSGVSSGVIYNNKNEIIHILTTCHSIDDAENIKVVFASGATYDAKLVNRDIYSDLAIIEVESDIEVMPAKLGDSRLIKDGEFMICIGTPKNLQYSFSNELAIVSSKLRTINNSITFDNKQYDYYLDTIQLSSNIQEGYSGAPIINMAGEVQGIITMKDDTAVFALPINEAAIIADNIINSETSNKIQFGFKGQLITSLENYEKNQLNIPLDINNGLFINNVRVNSLANSLGLKAGDIILSINGIEINDFNDLLKIEYSEANTFELEIVKNNERVTLTGSIND